MKIKSVTDSVVEYLRTKIVTGELEAGQKLNENTLASKLDVSRHPLREAFRILENEHIVAIIPRKGAYVSELSIDELTEFYQAREMIEYQAIDNLKARKIKKLPQVVESMAYASSLTLPDTDNLEQRLAYYQAFNDFHLKMIESAGNKLLVRFYKSIYIKLSQYQFICLYMPGESQKATHQEHSEILGSIETGKYHEAKKLVKVHLATTYAFLRGKISERE